MPTTSKKANAALLKTKGLGGKLGRCLKDTKYSCTTGATIGALDSF